MKKINVGITGMAGFVGSHLRDCLKTKENIEVLPFEDAIVKWYTLNSWTLKMTVEMDIILGEDRLELSEVEFTTEECSFPLRNP